MQISKRLVAALLLMLLLLQAHAIAQGDPTTSRTGISKTAPTNVRFVETELGYMVPYTQTIPGTDTKFEMLPISGGKFLFEIPLVEQDGVKPTSRFIEVEIEPFWIGKHEVTWGEFLHFMELNRLFKAFDKQILQRAAKNIDVDVITAPSMIYSPRYRMESYGGTPAHPAGSMTQFTAKQYTKWLSKLTEDFYRLPSAAQWQYACRAGNDDQRLALNEEEFWHFGNADGERQIVGSKPPNPWGIHDMLGNVSEWVLDGRDFSNRKWNQKSIRDANAISWPFQKRNRLTYGGDAFDEAGKCHAGYFKTSNKDWWNEDPDIPRSPFWMASDQAMVVGFRIYRPLHEPKTADARNRFWRADHAEIREDIDCVLESNGRGARGVVDPKWPDEIEGLRIERK